MKLPTISTPTYEVKLVSQDKPIHFRPFLVREHKLLLMASEGRDPVESIGALKEIAKNCVVEDIDIDSLPLVDLEVLFLHLRARSMGEIVDVYYKCKNDVSGKECGMLIECPINLLEVPVVNSDYERRIMLDEKIGIQLKVPTFEYAQKVLEIDVNTDEDADLKAVAGIIDYVFDNENVYYAKDATLEEMVTFVKGINGEKYEKIENYFNHFPTIKQTVEKKCPKCGYDHSFTLEGLYDFFI